MTKEEVKKHIAIIHNMAKDYGILTNEEINDTYKVLNYIDQQDQIIREAKEKLNQDIGDLINYGDGHFIFPSEIVKSLKLYLEILDRD